MNEAVVALLVATVVAILWIALSISVGIYVYRAHRGGVEEVNKFPHSHTPRITRTYPYSWEGGWFVHYGDTDVRFAWVWQRPDVWWSADKFDKAVRKATVKAIRKHDEGTQREARKLAKKEEYRSRVIPLPTLDPRRWGSEQLED